MSPTLDRRADLRDALAAVALAGLAAGLGEGLRTAPHAPAFGWGVTHGLFAWGLWTFAILALSVPALIGLLSRWRPAPDRPPTPLAWALAWATCAAVAMVPGRWAYDRFSETIAPESRSWVVVGAVLTAAAIVTAAAPALAWIYSRLSRHWRPSRRTTGLVGVLLGSAVAAAGAGVDARYAPVGLALMGAALSVLFPARGRRWLLVLPMVAAPALVGATWGLAGARAGTVRVPAAHGLLSGLAVVRLEAWSDDDEDGFGDRFGGLDCDDRDPFTHPAAVDVPGNGLDENCRAGDAPKQIHRPRLPVPKESLKTFLGDTAPHIILLVLDAVRADVLDGSGDLTPHLNAWIAKGTRFTRAFSTSSSTRHAVPAMLTGRWIGHTEYREKVSLYYVDGTVHTLPEALAEKSYRTAAVLPPFVHGRVLGMKRGFRHYVSFATRAELKASRGRTAPLAVADALEILDADYPFPTFLYVHLDDAHAPYSRTAITREDDGTPKGRYLNEINRMDQDLAPLLARIEALQAERPVILAITADHGEAFGEHGSFTHGRDLYQAVLHVPMVLIGPGIPAGKTIDEPVDLLDLGVTLAQAAGARLRDSEGHGLWGLIRGLPPPKRPRPLFAEMRILHAPYPVHTAVIEWPLKLLRQPDTGVSALYDLAADPAETRDLTRARPKDAARLAGLLLRWSELGTGPAGRFVPPK